MGDGLHHHPYELVEPELSHPLANSFHIEKNKHQNPCLVLGDNLQQAPWVLILNRTWAVALPAHLNSLQDEQMWVLGEQP